MQTYTIPSELVSSIQEETSSFCRSFSVSKMFCIPLLQATVVPLNHALEVWMMSVVCVEMQSMCQKRHWLRKLSTQLCIKVGTYADRIKSFSILLMIIYLLMHSYDICDSHNHTTSMLESYICSAIMLQYLLVTYQSLLSLKGVFILL